MGDLSFFFVCILASPHHQRCPKLLQYHNDPKKLVGDAVRGVVKRAWVNKKKLRSPVIYLGLCHLFQFYITNVAICESQERGYSFQLYVVFTTVYSLSHFSFIDGQNIVHSKMYYLG